MSKHHELVTVPVGVDRQRVIRTILQTIASVLTAAATLVAVLAVFTPAFLEAIRDILPEHWYASGLLVVAFTGTLAGVFTKIMAIPHVNTFLTRYGVGTEPRHHPETPPVAGT